MMLKPVRTVAPSVDLVTLAEVKAHCRVEHSDDDALLESLISAATSHLDGYSGVLGRALISQTWAVSFSGFSNVMAVPVGDVIAITSVQYFDENGQSQTAAASLYGLYADDRGPFIALKAGQSWPNVADRMDAVTVTWTCGYGAASSDVPAAIRHAVKMLAAHWYENREAVNIGSTPSELPIAVRSLLAPFCVVGI